MLTPSYACIQLHPLRTSYDFFLYYFQINTPVAQNTSQFRLFFDRLWHTVFPLIKASGAY